MRTLLVCAAVGLCAAALASAGCKNDGKSAKTAPVSGKVTVDKAPLASGTIAFEGTDGTPPTLLDITNGSYAGEVSTGKKRVRISAMKDAPPDKKATGPGADQRQIRETLPAEYNTESQEFREVKDSGPNEFDFAISTKK